MTKWWTADKVKKLEQDFDKHIDSCFECQDILDKSDGEEFEWCPVGKKLEDKYLDADMYYSWQHNFDGYGSYKPSEYSILCPCDKCFKKTMEGTMESELLSLEQALQQAFDKKRFLTIGITENRKSKKESNTRNVWPITVKNGWFLYGCINDEIYLDRFEILNLKDIVSVKYCDREKFLKHALKIRKNYPPVSTKEAPYSTEKIINMDSFSRMIETSLQAASHPFVVVYPSNDDVCWIGPISQISDKGFSLDKINLDGDYDETIIMPSDEIRSLEFDDSYAEALYLVHTERKEIAKERERATEILKRHKERKKSDD